MIVGYAPSYDGWNVLDQPIERKSQLNRIIIIFCVLTSNYNGYWSKIGVMFTRLKLWVAPARHNFEGDIFLGW